MYFVPYTTHFYSIDIFMCGLWSNFIMDVNKRGQAYDKNPLTQYAKLFHRRGRRESNGTQRMCGFWILHRPEQTHMKWKTIATNELCDKKYLVHFACKYRCSSHTIHPYQICCYITRDFIMNRNHKHIQHTHYVVLTSFRYLDPFNGCPRRLRLRINLIWLVCDSSREKKWHWNTHS